MGTSMGLIRSLLFIYFYATTLKRRDWGAFRLPLSVHLDLPLSIRLSVHVNERSFVGYWEQWITVNSINSVYIVGYFQCLVGYFRVENNKENTQQVPSCRHNCLSVGLSEDFQFCDKDRKVEASTSYGYFYFLCRLKMRHIGVTFVGGVGGVRISGA